MYQDHPTFTVPKNPKATIWRYMDFTKFVSMLDRRALFFARAISLDDPFEGSISKPTEIRRWEVMRPSGILDKTSISTTSRDLRKFVMLNCWHISDHESAALWKLYISGKEGIVLRSSVERLKSAFQPHPGPVYIGQINYLDYMTQIIPDGNIFEPFLHKRKSFEHEKELRAMVFDETVATRINEKGERQWDLSRQVNDGECVSVDLEVLIDGVLVSPTAQDWFLTLTASTVKRFGLDKKCSKSDLATDPIF